MAAIRPVTAAQRFVAIGAIMAMLAVAAGAFGAHAIKNAVEADLLVVWNTGAQYHMFHAIGLTGIGLIAHNYPNNKGIVWAGWLMLIGIIVFSGSLYALTLTGVRSLGAITPIGGMAFILAWLMLAISVLRARD